MGWDGWMIPCFEKVVSAHWLLTHIQSPPLRLLRKVHERYGGNTGSPSSKYEHQRASAFLRNIQNIRIYMGKNLSFL